MQIKRVGLDLAKQSIQVHAVDRHDTMVMKRSIKRAELLKLFTDRPACLIGMEACAGAHYWARELSRLGHTVRLMAPKHVKPYLQGQKNDANDAAAICEAVSRPTLRFVATKSVAQQDVQALHRIRSQCVEQRTAKVNLIRGLLAEYGIVIAQQVSNLRRALVELLEDAENGLTADFRVLLSGLREDLAYLDLRIAELTKRIEQHVASHEPAQRLMAMPGVGPMTASAFCATVGDAKAFANGRQLAAFLGLTPRQHSTGGKPKLLGIHKQGDSYLRGLLVHGARAVQRMAVKKTDSRSTWLNDLGKRRHKNIATVAQANKAARIAWVILAKGDTYRAEPPRRLTPDAAALA
jgi:transposase